MEKRLKQQHDSPEEIAKFFTLRTAKYFFDEGRFRKPRHSLVAERLYEWLSSRGLLDSE